MAREQKQRGRVLPSKPTEKKQGRCFFFHMTGKCYNGAFCRFLHEIPKKRWMIKPEPPAEVNKVQGGSGRRTLEARIKAEEERISREVDVLSEVSEKVREFQAAVRTRQKFQMMHLRSLSIRSCPERPPIETLASFLVARVFDERSIYERQLGMELKEEDHREARRQRHGGIHHAWGGSIRRRAFTPPPPPDKNNPNLGQDP